MARPLYLLAGQSNAGTLTLSHSFKGAFGDHRSHHFAANFAQGSSLYPREAKVDWYSIEDGDPITGEAFSGLKDQLTKITAENDVYLAGLIWVQGEGDTPNEMSSSAYKSNLEALIDGLKYEFNKDLFTTVVALSTLTPAAEGREHWQDVRNAQIDIASERTDVRLVDPDPFVSAFPLEIAYRDSIHYSFEFGEILFRAAADASGLAEISGIQPLNNGTDQDDKLNGGDLSDALLGFSGNDVLSGNDGIDFLYGHDGKDWLFGGLGNDLLDGGSGNDRMAGGDGNDYYRVDSRFDVIIEDAGEGYDTVEAIGRYTLGDHIESIVVPEWYNQGVIFEGNSLSNTIVGADGSDRLIGREGDDDLFGNNGNDTIFGGGGRDRLFGGDGADRLIGGLGNDFYRIDSRFDTIVEFDNQGYDTALTMSSFRLGNDVFVENLIARAGYGNIGIIGNAHNNRITGNVNDNALFGLDGQDAISGEGGADYINGGGGADKLSGGDGNDRIRAGSGSDSIMGGAGDDQIRADSGNDTLNGNDGRDLLIGGDGDDTLLGGEGNDLLNGGPGDDKLIGGAGRDLMLGGAGSDLFLFDGEIWEKDLARGGSGDDTFILSNNGYAYGQHGSDTFVFNDGFGRGTVLDFDPGSDILNLSGMTGVNSLDDVIFRQLSDRVRIDFLGEHDDHIILYGQRTDALTVTDFIF